MFLPCILVMQLCSQVAADNLKKPLGRYTPRNTRSNRVRAELNFLEDSSVKYTLNTPQLQTRTLSHPIKMITSSVVFVIISPLHTDDLHQHHPGAYTTMGLTVFFYDPVQNRITFNANGASFQLLHESDPANDAGPVTTTPPDGIYRSVNEIEDPHGDFPSSKFEVTMRFSKERGRALYRIVQNDADYSFPFEVDFAMISSSLIRVRVPQNVLHGLHGRFPGLTDDYSYMNLGYDSTTGAITFLLDQLRVVTLKRVQATTVNPTIRTTNVFVPPKTTAVPTARCGHRCRPFGDYCVNSNTAMMSLSFQDQYTTTFAGIYKGFHFLARGARYRVDVIEDPNRVVVSVDAINSELRGELRKLNWLGVTHLYFTFDPERNVVMLERHGLIAHMHISLGCAAAIETPPKEPSVDQEDALGGDKEVDDFLFELIKLLLS